MLNPDYIFNKVNDLVHEYEPSKEREIAVVKIEEAKMWLDRCTSTKEALEKDQSNG